MEQPRACGECTACCTVGAVPEIDKPANTPCKYLCGSQGGCSIFNDPMRPKVCSGFMCEWLKGAGDINDRPDKSGVMVSINELNGGMWIFVVELSPNAARLGGRHVIMDVADRVDLPVIISCYEEEAPNDFGSYTVVKDSLLPRAGKLIGECRGFLDSGKQFGIYDLKIH